MKSTDTGLTRYQSVSQEYFVKKVELAQTTKNWLERYRMSFHNISSE